MRLLQDRFQGTYAPSAGSIYPRLAKLEEEGLVSRIAEGNRMAYALTDAGRAEVRARAAELADVDREIQGVSRVNPCSSPSEPRTWMK